MRQGAAIALALAACAAPQTEGSGARVHAGPLHGPRISEILRDVEPKVIEILGTRWPREYKVTFKDIDYSAQTRDWDRKVTLGVASLTSEDLPLTIAHELAHVHMRGQWRELPPVLQEGVAVWVGLLALGRTQEFKGRAPDMKDCLDVLTIPYAEYLAADLSRKNELNYAATWIVANFMESKFDPQPRQRALPAQIGLPAGTPVKLTLRRVGDDLGSTGVPAGDTPDNVPSGTEEEPRPK